MPSQRHFVPSECWNPVFHWRSRRRRPRQRHIWWDRCHRGLRSERRTLTPWAGRFDGPMFVSSSGAATGNPFYRRFPFRARLPQSFRGPLSRRFPTCHAYPSCSPGKYQHVVNLADLVAPAREQRIELQAGSYSHRLMFKPPADHEQRQTHQDRKDALVGIEAEYEDVKARPGSSSWY
jgi:hypothetical protein